MDDKVFFFQLKSDSLDRFEQVERSKIVWPNCEKTYMLTSTAQDSHIATNGIGNGLDNNALSYFIKHVLYARQFPRRGPKSSKHTCLEKDHTLKEIFTRGMMF